MPSNCLHCGTRSDNGYYCSNRCEREAELAQDIREIEDQREAHEADQIDAFFERVDTELSGEEIDKCMNCGRYKATKTLTYPGQVCKSGCINPEEY